MNPPSTKRVRSGHSEYNAFVKRIIRAYGRRAANSDPEALAELRELRAEIDRTIAASVHGLREQGYSWTDIARPMGMTKQAAFNRWGNR